MSAEVKKARSIAIQCLADACNDTKKAATVFALRLRQQPELLEAMNEAFLLANCERVMFSVLDEVEDLRRRMDGSAQRRAPGATTSLGEHLRAKGVEIGAGHPHAVGGGHPGDVDHRMFAPAARPANSPRRFSGQAAQAVTATVLTRMIVNGRPIGDCTAGEVSQSAAANERDARFKRMLVSGMQPDMVIGSKITVAEAEQMWKMAQAPEPPTITAEKPGGYEERAHA